jgi:Putative abortive phage resistance protein AbiGi, antitoxin
MTAENTTDPAQCNKGLSGSPLVGGTHTPDVDDTEAAYSRVICFCDIPVTDLAIHMTKYSRFGLSFLKPFLVRKGANPVLYVANNSQALSFDNPPMRSNRSISYLQLDCATLRQSVATRVARMIERV